MPDLVLGPILRHVDTSSATVWVQTDGPCTVEVAGCEARTFQVGGHHFALVVITGLTEGSTPYQVRLDGEQVWPLDGLPPSRIRITGDAEFSMVFGSCRIPESDDPALGRDATAAYAQRMSGQDERQWPDSLVLLGDQVYADETTEAMRDWISRRRPVGDPPGVANFDEYVHLYYEAWSTRWNRWLMSTVPTSMIFDDHDVIDDWNTSQTWREQMERTDWWAERETAALVSYWIYQHIGNLAPADLAADPTYNKVIEAQGDAIGVLRTYAQKAIEEVDGRKTSRWSYRRDFGRVRLLMLDTRAGRILSGDRQIINDEEFTWIEANAEGDYDHLLLGSSLPWLMPHVISDLQSLNEIGCRRPGWRGRLAEKIRQVCDLEHWPAFRASFDRMARLVRRIADGDVATVCVLSGDVHHVYTAEAHFDKPVKAKVYQLVCSPTHNRVPALMRPFFRLAWSRGMSAVSRWWLRRHIPTAPVEWTKLGGPYVGNAIATLRISGRRAEVLVEKAADLSPVTELTLSTG
ncbi:MAG: alkaline phosphatase D family protein [Kibdelosporangium sp.]